MDAAKAEQGGPLPGCRLVVGDFFSEVPAGADAYILQKIIHDWDDEASVTILRNIAAAMKPESRLYIIDMILDSGDTIGTRSDLYMLVVCGGAERTIEESDALYARAGLKRTKVIETNAPWKVIEAKLAH